MVRGDSCGLTDAGSARGRDGAFADSSAFFPLDGEGLFDRLDQSIHISVKTRFAQLDRIPSRERCQCFWKILPPPHPYSAKEDWDDPNVALECSDDFHARKILFVVETLTRRHRWHQPVGADRDDSDVTSAAFAVDHFHEVFARLDLVDIDEDLVLAKVPEQVVAKAMSIGCGVFTATVDEELRVHVLEGRECPSGDSFYGGVKSGVELSFAGSL